jgi:hypothetical protein
VIHGVGPDSGRRKFQWCGSSSDVYRKCGGSLGISLGLQVELVGGAVVEFFLREKQLDILYVFLSFVTLSLSSKRVKIKKYNYAE